MTLGSQPAVAADHSDGDAVGSNAAADIADLYAWTSDGSDILTLIMMVPGPVSADVQYVFHVGRQDTAHNAATAWAGAGETTDIICVLGGGGADTQCWVGDPDAGGDYVAGDATPDTGITSDSGDVRVHINTNADPFFFFADGFMTAITAVNTAFGGLNLNDNDFPDAAIMAGAGPLVLGAGCEAGANDTVSEALVDILGGAIDWTAGTGCAATTPSNAFMSANVDAEGETDPSSTTAPSTTMTTTMGTTTMGGTATDPGTTTMGGTITMGGTEGTDGGTTGGGIPAPPALSAQIDRAGRAAISTALVDRFGTTTHGTAVDA